MKVFNIVLIVIFIVIGFTIIVVADSNTDVIANGIGYYIAIMSGFLANRVIERVKLAFPFLTDDDQTNMKRIIIEAFSFVISIATALLIGYSAKALGLATPSDLISAILLSYPVAYTTFLATKVAS